MLVNIIRNSKKSVGGGGDPYYSAVSLMLSMDGTNGSTTFTDSSLNALTVTASGNAQISTTLSKYGGASGYFDGSGDYLIAPSGTQFNYGTGDFTWEFWFNSSSWAAGNNYLLDHSTSTAGSIQYFNGVMRYYNPAIGTGSILYTSGFGSGLSTGTWYHLAVSRQSGTTRLFLNGNLINSASDAHNFATNRCVIGAAGSLGAPYNGYIDDLRISRFARYVSNFTPPTAALPTTASSTVADPYYGYTSLLLHMDGTNASTNFVDSGPSALTVTRTGTPAISTSQSKYGGSSAALSGTADRLDVASNALFAFGTGDFTVEFWLYFNSVSTAQTSFVNVNVAGGFSCYWTGSLYYSVPANNFVVSNRSVGQFQSSWTPSANTWYHVAISRNGTNLRVFINGTQLGSTVTSSTNYIQGPLQIGGSTDGAGWTVNGYIDDLRITKYARYTAAFTPPTTAFPNA